MKPRATFAFLLFSFVLCSVVACASPIATVQSANDTSIRRSSLSSFMSLNGRTPLNSGDVVRTGPRGKANLLFLDGSQIRLNANTTIEITPPSGARGGRQSFFRALSGEVYARLRPGSAMRSRTAVAGVRGTELLMQVGEDGTTTLTVIEGAVDFYNDFGAVVVNSSQQSSAAPGRAPTTPITIANPGLLIEWTFDADFVVLPREKFWLSRDVKALESTLQRASTPDKKGDALFDLHRYEEALEAYQQAERLARADAEVKIRIGYALLELRRLDEAQEYFRAVVGKEKMARSARARVQFVAASEDDGPRLSVTSTQRATALVGMAWVQLQRNEAKGAEQFALQAVGLDSNSVEARLVAGISQMRQAGMLAAAIESFQKAEVGEPEAMRYQATAWLAMALLARDDRAGALKSAQAAVQAAPDSGLARGNLALALLFNDRAHDAAKEARRATLLNPDSVAARVALAQSLLAKGDADAAAREAALAAALDPELPQGLYVLGLADAARRDYSHAARELEQSLKTAPDFLPSASALARVYTLMGREHEAVALLTGFQTRHPLSSEVLAALGQVYYQQGKYHDAVEQYQKAIAKQPNSALYQAELARLLLDDNQLNASLQAAQRAVFLAPEVGQYHAMLGLVADFSGLAAYADREYRTAIALDPQNALARARIGLNSAGDPRTGFNTTTQAFLYDPSISRQLFRGGVQGEVTVTAGSDHALGVLSGHRLQSEDGRIYEYGIESARRSDGFDDAPNDDTRQYGIQELINIVPDNRTNILVRGSATKNEFGFNAPTSSLDNRSEVALPRASIGMRRRIGQKHHLWAGVRYDSIRARDTDPNSDSFFFDFINPFLLVTENQELRARVIEPELRLDLDLGETPGKSTLSLGTSYTKQRTFFRQDVTFRDITTLNPPLPLGSQDGDGTRRVRLYYAQLAHRLNDKTSFVAQLRRQDVKSTLSSVFLGIPQGTAVTDTSDILPSLLINHQLSNKTALRFYAYRSKFDSGLQTFAPTETLLASENSVFPLGASDQVRLYELEAEHYFSPRTFGKLFVFRSRANGLTIGGLALDETTRTGVGVRLEHRIGHNLFSSLLLSRNRTTSQTAGMNFSGQSPYQPRYLARVALNYVAADGNRAGIAVNYTGSFFQDTLLTGTNRPHFPSKTTVDLRLAHEPSLKNEIFFNVINVFNADQIVANGVPAPGRRFEVGWTRRF